MSNASSNAFSDPEQPKTRSVVPWNPWVAVLFVVVIFYGSQLFGGTLVSIYPILKHWTRVQAAAWLSGSVFWQFVFILIAELFVIAAIYGFLRFYKQGFAAIGLKKPTWLDLLYGLSAVPVYFILYLLTVGVVSHFVPGLNVNEQQQVGFNDVQGILQLVLTFISLVVLPPLAEEIMVRGFLYSSLKKAMPTAGAVVLTSVIFASAHLPEGGAAGPLYIAALDTFVLSLVLIYLREITGSLWASITLHAVKNGIAFAALFVIHAR